MENSKKPIPTSTASQARIQIYEPSQRPSKRDGTHVIVTPWGRCKVTGRLGQRHADLMDAMLFCAHMRRDTDDGGIELLVDPARVRRTLSDSQYSHEQIKNLIRDLRASSITIELPKWDWPIVGGLLDHVVPCEVPEEPLLNPLKKENRHWWLVRVGIAMRLLIQEDLHLFYDPAPIARLRHGITQAVARHVLTHKASPVAGWHIDTIIAAVMHDPSGQALRDARRRLLEEVDALKKMGIEIDTKNKRVHKKEASDD